MQKRNITVPLVLAILVIALLASWYFVRKGGEGVEYNPLSNTGLATSSVVADENDMIRVTSPRMGSIIESPLVVTGEARGSWYFEASFPVTVVNWDGLIIGEGFAEAQGEWMTSDYVPFRGTIEFEDPTYSNRGAVIFQKDNPSGLPEMDAALEIPITFKNVRQE